MTPERITNNQGNFLVHDDGLPHCSRCGNLCDARDTLGDIDDTLICPTCFWPMIEGGEEADYGLSRGNRLITCGGEKNLISQNVRSVDLSGAAITGRLAPEPEEHL